MTTVKLIFIVKIFVVFLCSLIAIELSKQHMPITLETLNFWHGLSFLGFYMSYKKFQKQSRRGSY